MKRRFIALLLVGCHNYAGIRDAFVDDNKDLAPSDLAVQCPNPNQASKRVFVSSQSFTGNLSSPECSVGQFPDPLLRTDCICTRLAEGGGLGGLWSAWISSDTTSALQHINGGPWHLPCVDPNSVGPLSPTMIGSIELLAPIDRDEKRAAVDDSVWTGTQTDGSRGVNCNNWTSAGNDQGNFGNSTRLSTMWTRDNQGSCMIARRLYCFER